MFRCSRKEMAKVESTRLQTALIFLNPRTFNKLLVKGVSASD